MKEKIVLFASPREGKLVKSHLRVYTELQKRGVPVYSIDCRTAKVLDEGKIEGDIAKIGRRVLEFDPSVTACVVSNGIVGNKACREFVEDLEEMGVYVLNSLDGIDIARNKATWDRVCRKNGIPSPKTVLVNTPKELDEVLAEFKFPVVCKTCTGSLGVGVFKMDKPSMVRPVFQAMWKVAPNLKEDGILIQDFLQNHGDVRTIVVGDEIVGSMKRIAKEGDFRNNFSQGGTVENYNLTTEEEETVKKAAKASGCEICGVDHIVGEDGNVYVIEVNSCPGTDGFLTVHKDVIEKMADYVLSKCGDSTRTTVIGSQETIDLEEIGKVTALMDLGDGSNSKLDAREITVDDGTVSFKTNGKQIKMPIHDIATYTVNGTYVKVPVVKLDMKLGKAVFPGVKFELVNREGKSSQALLSRDFLAGHKYLIDPNRKNTIMTESVIPDLEDDREATYMSELSDEALVCLFALTRKGRAADKPLTDEALQELEFHGFIDKNDRPTDAGWEYLTSSKSVERLDALRDGTEFGA